MTCAKPIVMVKMPGIIDQMGSTIQVSSAQNSFLDPTWSKVVILCRSNISILAIGIQNELWGLVEWQQRLVSRRLGLYHLESETTSQSGKKPRTCLSDVGGTHTTQLQGKSSHNRYRLKWKLLLYYDQAFFVMMDSQMVLLGRVSQLLADHYSWNLSVLDLIFHKKS